MVTTVAASALGSIADCPRRAVCAPGGGGPEAAAAIVGTVAHRLMELELGAVRPAAWSIADIRARSVRYDSVTPSAREAWRQADAIARRAAEAMRALAAAAGRGPHDLYCGYRGEAMIPAGAGECVRVTGEIDVIVTGRRASGAEAPGIVADLKTGTVGSTAAAQMGAYMAIAGLGRDAADAAIIHLPRRLVARDPDAEPTILRIPAVHAVQAARNAAALWARYGGEFHPALVPGNPYSFRCGRCDLHRSEHCPDTNYLIEEDPS